MQLRLLSWSSVWMLELLVSFQALGEEEVAVLTLGQTMKRAVSVAFPIVACPQLAFGVEA